uniref:Uncharacterized protein n=1 Tax=Anguilla anguilla TaxID=7936 RepID=A0A0E9QYF2_ANGAN
MFRTECAKVDNSEYDSVLGSNLTDSQQLCSPGFCSLCCGSCCPCLDIPVMYGFPLKIG